MTLHRHLPRTLAAVTTIAAAALPLVAACVWLFWDALAPIVAAEIGTRFALDQLALGGRLAALTLSMIGALVQAWGLLGLRRTFSEAASGRALSAAALSGFRRFAWVSVAMVPIVIVQRTALIALFTAADPSMPGQISIQLGTPELARLFYAVLLVFVARVFAEGRAAKAENEGFL